MWFLDKKNFICGDWGGVCAGAGTEDAFVEVKVVEVFEFIALVGDAEAAERSNKSKGVVGVEGRVRSSFASTTTLFVFVLNK